MPGYDYNVSQHFCLNNGHNIMTVVKNTVWDDSNKVFVDDKEVMCVRCGIALEDIRTMKKTRGPRKTTGGAAPAPEAAA